MKFMVKVGENHTQCSTRNKVIVTSDLQEIFGKYRERLYGLYLLYEDIFEKCKCCNKLREPKSDKPTNFERLVEGIAIQLALIWEIFTIDVYLNLIVEYPDEFCKQQRCNISRYKERYNITDTNWKPDKPEKVEEILIVEKKSGYIPFKNTLEIKKKTEAFIDRKDENKNPFLIFNKEPRLLEELDKFIKLRNYLVHRNSNKSEREFKESFTVDNKEPRSPGQYLSLGIEVTKGPQRYNKKHELSYFIEVFKQSLYKMAEAKSISLPDWPQSYEEWLKETLSVIKEPMGRI